MDADGRPTSCRCGTCRCDGALLITPRAESAWLPNLKPEPWVAAVIDEGVLPQRKVVVSTRAEILHEPGHDDAWRDVYRRICLRYWDEKAVDSYLESTIHVRRALISVPVRFGTPEVQTWRLPVADEDPPRHLGRALRPGHLRKRCLLGELLTPVIEPAAARQPSGLSR